MTRARTRTIDELPLFASDREIAEAVVGPSKADDWIRDYLPLIEKQPGFPHKERSHGGRYTPAIKAFYDRRYRLDDPNPGVDGREDPESWRRKSRR